MSSPPFNTWFARVQFLQDSIKETVPLKLIKRQGKTSSTRRNFEPISVTDFNPRVWYWVKTLRGSPDGKMHSFPALIGDIFESEEDAAKAGRFKCVPMDQVLNLPSGDGDSTATDTPPSKRTHESPAESRQLKRLQSEATRNQSVNLLKGHIADSLSQIRVESENGSNQDLLEQVRILNAQLAEERRRRENLEQQFQEKNEGHENMNSEASSNGIAGMLAEFQKKLQHSIQESNKSLREDIVKVKEDMARVEAMINEMSKFPVHSNHRVEEWLSTCRQPIWAYNDNSDHLK